MARITRFKLTPIGAAVAAMLAGPGIALAQTTGTTGATGAETTLPEVKVRDAAPGGDFAPGLSNAGGRVPTPIRDIPQTVNVINRAVMESQGATSLADALRSVPASPSAPPRAAPSATTSTCAASRRRTDLYLDGMRDRGQIYRDVFSLEQIEVLKGPSSMLYGRGSTGGVINQVSKVPSLTPHNEASVSLGTQPSLRTTADLNQPLSDTSAFRISVMAQDVNSTRGRDAEQGLRHRTFAAFRHQHTDRSDAVGAAQPQQGHARLRPAAGQRRPRAGEPPHAVRPHRRPHHPGRRAVHRQGGPQADFRDDHPEPDALRQLRGQRAGIRAEQHRHRHGRRLHRLPHDEPGQQHQPAAVAAVFRARQPRPRHHRQLLLQPDRPHHQFPDRRSAPRFHRRPWKWATSATTSSTARATSGRTISSPSAARQSGLPDGGGPGFHAGQQRAIQRHHLRPLRQRHHDVFQGMETGRGAAPRSLQGAA